MIHVIIVMNPFDRKNGRKDYYEEWESNKPLSAYHSEPGNKVYSVNGILKKSSDVVEDGQEIVVSPKIEGKAFKWILGIGLLVVSAGIGAGSIVAWSSLGLRIGASLALSMIGNHVISGLTAPKVDLSNTEQSNTYGWGTPQTLTGQGYVLPVVYGKVKTAGLMLQRHVVSNGTKQYLNALYCLAEGTIDEVTDIKLNGNPIDNFEDIKTEIRNGSNQQSIIPDFDNSYADTALAYELNPGKWNTVTLDGNTAQGIEITISFPSGLYYSNDNGNPDWTSVTVKAQYRKVGANDWDDIPIRNENYKSKPEWAKESQEFANSMSWIEHYNTECRTFHGYKTYIDEKGKTHTSYDNNGEPIPIYTYTMTYDEWRKKVEEAHLYEGIIRNNTNAAFYRMWGVDNLEPAQYEVRVQCVSKDRSDTRTANKVQWVGVTQIIYDDFSYPGKALLGLKALATDQLSGSDPSMTCVIERKNVQVWNPIKKAYEQLPANNPAWAAYDILHHCRKVLKADNESYEYVVTGIDKENMDYYQFKAWADRCDKAKITFNYIYDSAMKIWDALNYPCRVGHGCIIIVGTRVSCIFDYESLPSQLFTVANIKKDSFSNEYLDSSSRANCVEISFINKDKNYERDVLSVYSDEYDSADTVSQPTQIELMGCTDAEQAYKYGSYLLRQNKYQIRTVQFQAFADAIACEIGDVITVQEDIVEWGIGGRVIKINANNVTLDREIDEKYTDFLFRENSTDRIVKRKILFSSGNVVTLDNISGITSDCIYALGRSGCESKQFKVMSIASNMNEETKTITAIEYYPEIYSIDIGKVPMLSKQDTSIESPKNLILTTERYTESDGTTTSLVHCSWINPRQPYPVSLEISQDGINWSSESKFTAGENTYTFRALTDRLYYVRIYSMNDIGEKSEIVSSNIVTGGIDKLPPDVKTINAEKLSDGTRRYWWDFDYPTPNDIAGFRIKRIQGDSLNWDTAISVQDGLVTNMPYESQTVLQGSHTVMIKAVDNAGNESENFAYCRINLGEILEENVLIRSDFKDDNWGSVKHDGKILSDGYIHAKENSLAWNEKKSFKWINKNEYMWNNIFNEYTAFTSFKVAASGQFFLKFDISGFAEIYYKELTTNPFWIYSSKENAFWKKESYFWKKTSTVDNKKSFWKPYSNKIMVNKNSTIQIKVRASPNHDDVIIKSLEAIIDVPDRNEHFEDLQISKNGTELPIVTPNYKTTAVHLDAIQQSTASGLKIVSRSPCIIQLINSSGESVEGVADVSWQGYEEDI